MYLGGYSAECLLKARLMERLNCVTLIRLEAELKRRSTIADSDSIFTHNLSRSLTLVGCHDRLSSDPAQWRRFSLVNQWVPAWQYAPEPKSSATARTFLDATGDIVRWIENNT